MRPLAIAGLCMLLLACGHRNPHYQPELPHHRPDGFRNTEAFALPGTGDLLRWSWRRLISPAPAHDPDAVPWQAADVAELHRPSDALRATWLGQATVLVQTAGWQVLTDPVFADRASPLSWLGPRRQRPLPLAPAALPAIDAVVISHNHYDHLDLDALRTLQAQQARGPRVIVPLGNEARLRRAGLREVTALDWWQTLTLDAPGRPSLQVTLTPARHWSLRRFFPSDRDQALWGSYVLATARHRVYFAGDSGYAPLFAEIGRRLGPFDLALLPIGAYEPRAYLKAQHVNPHDAVLAHRDLRSRQSVGIHWGTFVLSSELLQQPPADLAAALAALDEPAERFQIWPMGQTRTVSPP